MSADDFAFHPFGERMEHRLHGAQQLGGRGGIRHGDRGLEQHHRRGFVLRHQIGVFETDGHSGDLPEAFQIPEQARQFSERIQLQHFAPSESGGGHHLAIDLPGGGLGIGVGHGEDLRNPYGELPHRTGEISGDFEIDRLNRRKVPERLRQAVQTGSEPGLRERLSLREQEEQRDGIEHSAPGDRAVGPGRNGRVRQHPGDVRGEVPERDCRRAQQKQSEQEEPDRRGVTGGQKNQTRRTRCHFASARHVEEGIS